MRKTLLCIVAFKLSLIVSESAAEENIDGLLEPIRVEYGLPGLSAAVIRGDAVVAVGAVGFRKEGATVRITPSDKFHIGSCTKSMTATTAAMLVQEGKLSWGTTIEDVFPELKESMHPDYRLVTLDQLLRHRGGMPNELIKDDLWNRIWQNTQIMTPVEQRCFLVREVLKQGPEVKPGEKFIYSNAGYAVAGAMMEKITGEPWELLMQRYIFLPLKMDSAGFGPPAKPGQTDQPWGHILENDKWKPIPPGPGADNPAAIGPAGTVHCSIYDLAEYASFHLMAEKGKGHLLNGDSFDKLHVAVSGQDYALGWGVLERGWGGGTVLSHSGSNTMFFSVIWIAPRKDFAVVVACNAGGDRAAKGCDQAASKLIQKYLLSVDRP